MWLFHYQQTVFFLQRFSQVHADTGLQDQQTQTLHHPSEYLKIKRLGIIYQYSASNLKVCTQFLQQLFLSHDKVLRFEWKRFQNEETTLWQPVDRRGKRDLSTWQTTL